MGFDARRQQIDDVGVFAADRFRKFVYRVKGSHHIDLAFNDFPLALRPQPAASMTISTISPTAPLLSLHVFFT